MWIASWHQINKPRHIKGLTPFGLSLGHAFDFDWQSALTHKAAMYLAPFQLASHDFVNA